MAERRPSRASAARRSSSRPASRRGAQGSSVRVAGTDCHSTGDLERRRPLGRHPQLPSRAVSAGAHRRTSARRPSPCACPPARRPQTIGPILRGAAVAARARRDRPGARRGRRLRRTAPPSSPGAWAPRSAPRSGLLPELGPVLGKGDAMWRALSVLTGDVVVLPRRRLRALRRALRLRDRRAAGLRAGRAVRQGLLPPAVPGRRRGDPPRRRPGDRAHRAPAARALLPRARGLPPAARGRAGRAARRCSSACPSRPATRWRSRC